MAISARPGGSDYSASFEPVFAGDNGSILAMKRDVIRLSLIVISSDLRRDVIQWSFESHSLSLIDGQREIVNVRNTIRRIYGLSGFKKMTELHYRVLSCSTQSD